MDSKNNKYFFNNNEYSLASVDISFLRTMKGYNKGWEEDIVTSNKKEGNHFYTFLRNGEKIAIVGVSVRAGKWFSHTYVHQDYRGELTGAIAVKALCIKFNIKILYIEIQKTSVDFIKFLKRTGIKEVVKTPLQRKNFKKINKFINNLTPMRVFRVDSDKLNLEEWKNGIH